MNEQHDLSPDEARALRQLQRPADPPATLYDSIARGAGVRKATPRSWAPVVLAAAAVLVAFVGGFKAGEGRAATPVRPSGNDYLLLLLNSPPPRPDTSKTTDEIVAEYVAWSRGLASTGQLSVSDELAPQRFLVDSAGPRAGAIADGADGVFVVRAPTADSVLAIARTLPHVRQGGAVSVQPIVTR